MALNKATLATEIENAFKASQADPTPAAQTTLCTALAQAIYNYLIHLRLYLRLVASNFQIYCTIFFPCIIN